jgi:PilZ domain
MLFAKALIGLGRQHEKRRDMRRSSSTLEVSFEGGCYRTIDWSLSGVLLSDYFGPLAPGDQVSGSFLVVANMASHPFKAVVVRRDSALGQLALNFTDISNSAFSMLESIKMDQYGM